MSLFESLIAGKVAADTVASGYQEIIDERDHKISLWQQANNKLKAENRKHMLLMRAERSSRMGWQQNSMSLTEVMMDAGETVESITEASHRMIASRQDDLAVAFEKEKDRIEREVEDQLERERNGG